MTIIKATCPVCGDVELTHEQVRLVMHPVKERSYYAFLCDRCDDEVRKPANSEVIRLLRLGGVVAETPDIPAEALEDHVGAVLTPDDVLDFISWLDGATAVAAAAAAGLHQRIDDNSDSSDPMTPSV